MVHSLKRLGNSVLAVLIAVFMLPNFSAGLTLSSQFEEAHGAGVANPTWSLSSATESATNVTYTHTFVTSTTVGVGSVIDIELRQPPGPPQPMPDFSQATLASGTTVGFAGTQPRVFPAGQSLNLSLFNSTTTIPAGLITLVFSGVTNPPVGGNIGTNTSISKDGQLVEGERFTPNPAGKMVIGTVKLSGAITDAATGLGIAGVGLEIHPGPNSPGGSNNMWRTTTDSTGAYSFAGLTNGTFVFEMSQVDPSSSAANTVSQYSRFEPLNITITDAPQVISKSLSRSQKLITGKVLYAGTTTPVVGAMVNAGSMGGPGGFANTETDALGAFTIRLAASGNVFFMVQPAQDRGPQQPAGQPGQPQQQQVRASDFGAVQRQLAFTKPASEPETFDLGNLEVRQSDATVSGKLLNPDGSAASGGAGLQDFREHTFVPMMLGTDGSFSAKVISGSNFKMDSFDPNGLYSLPRVEFVAKKGVNDLGTITKIANDKTITLTALRIDGGTERPIANAQAMVFSKDPGPPFFATTNVSGVATVKVPTGFEGRAGLMPGGSFGGGPKNDGQGEGDKGGSKPGGNEPSKIQELSFMSFLVADRAQAAASSDSSDIQQLFPVTGFQKVVAGDSVTVKFDKADKSVRIRTVDSAGVAVTDGAFVEARATAAGGPGARFGCPTAGGLGTCYTTAGSIEFQAMFPPDSEYTGQATTAVIAADGQSVDVVVLKKTVTLTGQVVDGSNSNAVITDPTLNIQVGAFGKGNFSFGKYDPTTGSYTMKIAPDAKVRLGVAAGDPGRGINQGGYVPNIDQEEISGTTGQTITKNVTLKKVDAAITGKVTDESGNALEGIAIVADPGLADLVGPEGQAGPGPGPGGPGGPPPGEGPAFGFSGITDATGTYTINLVPDKYNVVVKADKSKGLFQTAVSQAEPKSGETKTVDIQLAKADATVTLDINKSDSSDLSGATLQVYNEKGTIAVEVEDGGTGDKDGKVNGQVEISLPSNNTYNFKAGDDNTDSGHVEESLVKKIELKAGDDLDTTLKTVGEDNALGKPTTSEVSSSSATTVTMTKGTDAQASIFLPSGSLSSSSSSESSSDSSSSGSPVIELSAMKGELPEAVGADPVGVAVSINATGADGSAITSFNGSVPIEIHYDEGDIPEGVTESSLKLNFYNETTGQWEPLSVTAVDTAANVVSGTTSHLTDFAIVADADAGNNTDVTAPAKASDLRVVAKNSGKKVANKLSWKNPTDSDFDHLNIYRSTKKGTLGDKVKSTAKGDTSYTDSGLNKKSTYYYTFRSVDATGNSTTNTDQVTIASTKARVKADAKTALNKAKAASAAKQKAAVKKAGKNSKAKAAANKQFAKEMAAINKAYAAAIKGF